MDILALDPKEQANEGAMLELRDPNGAPMLKPDGEPVTITLLGTDSDTFQKASNAQTNRHLRSKGQVLVTAESALSDHINLLAKITVDWDGIGIGEPETLFTEDAAKKLYRVNFIREQVERFIADRGNFIKASPTA